MDFPVLGIEKQVLYYAPASNNTTSIMPTMSTGGLYSYNLNSIGDERVLRTLFIVKDPNICDNEPIIRGTRISVANIVEWHYLLSWDIRKIKDEYPYLNDQQILAAIEYYEEHTREIDSYLQQEKEVDG